MTTETRYAVTTKAADGTEVTGRGKTYPEAIRDAKKKAADHSRANITQSEGVVYVRRS